MLLGSISSTVITEIKHVNLLTIMNLYLWLLYFPLLMTIGSCRISNSYEVVCDKDNRKKLKHFYYARKKNVIFLFLYYVFGLHFPEAIW